MMGRRSLGRQFGWLWAAYAISAYGSWFGFGAMPLIAILVLHAGPGAVAALPAAGLAVGAAVALPLGSWIEFRRKRPVMITMDLARFVALASIPAAFALGWLSFVQLLIVSVIAASADITFKAASGACLKALVPPADLLVANGRLESTTWTATVVGPPIGGAAIGLFGPVTTVLADAVSYLLSAVGIRAIGGREEAPAAPPAGAPAAAPAEAGAPSGPVGTAAGDAPGGSGRAARVPRVDLLAGWRYILGHPALRRMFFNTMLVNGLIMATEPLLSVLLLGQLGFPPWQYGLAFAAPCLGGFVGSRLARRLVARFGQHRVMITAGTLRACWLIPLAFVRPGVAGLVLVMLTELGLITSCGVFNPVLATYRLEQTEPHRVARTLSAWWVTSKASIAAMTGLWGLLAELTSPRTAIAVAGLLILATPLLLPRHAYTRQPEPELVGSHA
jgi:MFS transporter